MNSYLVYSVKEVQANSMNEARSMINDTGTDSFFCQGSFNSCIGMVMSHTTKNDKKTRTDVYCSTSRRSTEPDSVMKYR